MVLFNDPRKRLSGIESLSRSRRRYTLAHSWIRVFKTVVESRAMRPHISVRTSHPPRSDRLLLPRIWGPPCLRCLLCLLLPRIWKPPCLRRFYASSIPILGWQAICDPSEWPDFLGVYVKRTELASVLISSALGYQTATSVSILRRHDSCVDPVSLHRQWRTWPMLSGGDQAMGCHVLVYNPGHVSYCTIEYHILSSVLA